MSDYRVTIEFTDDAETGAKSMTVRVTANSEAHASWLAFTRAAKDVYYLYGLGSEEPNPALENAWAWDLTDKVKNVIAVTETN